MNKKTLDINEVSLNVETNANDKQWSHIVKYLNELHDQSKQNIIRELKSFRHLVSIEIME